MLVSGREILGKFIWKHIWIHILYSKLLDLRYSHILVTIYKLYDYFTVESHWACPATAIFPQAQFPSPLLASPSLRNLSGVASASARYSPPLYRKL